MYKEFDSRHSAYPSEAGHTLFWLPGDTQKLYQKNIIKNFDLIKSQGWYETEIEYSFNHHGFRCNEFDDSPNIIFLGCSFTVGIGLPLSCTFSQLIADRLSLKNYNFGLGGGSNSSAFRIGSYWIPLLKPDIVVLLSPSINRFEMFSNSSMNASKLVPNNYPHKLKEFYENWLRNDINSDLDQLKNHKALEQICHENKSRFINLSLDNDFIHCDNDWARDLMHSGPQSHALTAEHILTNMC